MKHPRLEAERENEFPKCCTCRHWEGRDTGYTSSMCDLHKTRTLDLARRSAWELHEVLHGQIMEPEQ